MLQNCLSSQDLRTSSQVIMVQIISLNSCKGLELLFFFILSGPGSTSSLRGFCAALYLMSGIVHGQVWWPQESHPGRTQTLSHNQRAQGQVPQTRVEGWSAWSWSPRTRKSTGTWPFTKGLSSWDTQDTSHFTPKSPHLTESSCLKSLSWKQNPFWWQPEVEEGSPLKLSQGWPFSLPESSPAHPHLPALHVASLTWFLLWCSHPHQI